jgi:glycosyltransferase involved in cell wall biosynthesis
VDGPDGSGQGRAIATARLGIRLVLAGPVQPGQEDYFRSEIEPHLDGDMVRFVGEVGGTRRKELFAHAKAFVMPIRWAEPFGMVMVEALACGTPVIAFSEGAASEIVIDGQNRRPRRRRASDGRHDRLARCDRPAPLPRKRRLALRHRDRRRRLRSCLPVARRVSASFLRPAARGARGAAGIAGG